MKDNIDNISVLMKKSPDVVKTIELAKMEQFESYYEDSKKYGDTFIEYNKFINKLVSFLKKMNLNSSIEFSIAIKYLIDNGYLSKDGVFYRKEPINEFQSRYGLNIIDGNGVCRNYAYFHNDVMKKLGEYCKRYFCASCSCENAENMSANHILNLIKYNDCLYGIDLAKKLKLHIFVTCWMLQEISIATKMSAKKDFTDIDILYYKPYLEMTSEMCSFEDIQENLKLFGECSIVKDYISPKEYYNSILPKTIKYLAKERDTFTDFHIETLDIKNNIVEGMKRRLK